MIGSVSQPPAQFIAPLNGATLVDHRLTTSSPIAGFAPLGTPVQAPSAPNYPTLGIARPASTFTTLETGLKAEQAQQTLVPAYNIYPDQIPQTTHHGNPLLGTFILAIVIFFSILGISFLYAIGLGIIDLGNPALQSAIDPIVKALPLIPQ